MRTENGMQIGVVESSKRFDECTCIYPETKKRQQLRNGNDSKSID